MSDFYAKDLPKMPPRRENRVAIVQFLYMWDMNPAEDVEESIRVFFATREQPRDFYSFAEKSTRELLRLLDTIDSKIQDNVKNWIFSRIAKIDLAILRLAIYELLYCKDIPPIVSINEAIELSKFLSDSESRRFINGVLDRIKADLGRPLREGLE